MVTIGQFDVHKDILPLFGKPVAYVSGRKEHQNRAVLSPGVLKHTPVLGFSQRSLICALILSWRHCGLSTAVNMPPADEEVPTRGISAEYAAEGGLEGRASK